MHLLHFLSSFYYQAEEIASVSFSLIKKWKSISPFFPPPYFFSSFLSCRGMCDERALLMWSCRDPFRCQQHGFLWRTLFDEFACFKFCLCVCAFTCVCSYLILCVKALSYLWCFCVCFSGVCHVWPVHGVASGTHVTIPAATWMTAWWVPPSSSTVRLVMSRFHISRLLSLIICVLRNAAKSVAEVSKDMSNHRTWCGAWVIQIPPEN